MKRLTEKNMNSRSGPGILGALDCEPGSWAGDGTGRGRQRSRKVGSADQGIWVERSTFTLDIGINNGEKEGELEGEEHHADIFRFCRGSVIFTSLGAGLQGVKSPWENPHGARENPLQTGLAEYFCPRLPDPVKKKKKTAREKRPLRVEGVRLAQGKES